MTVYADGVEGKRARPGERACIEHPASLNQVVGVLVSHERTALGERVTMELEDGGTLTVEAPAESILRVKRAHDDDFHPRSLPAIVLRQQLMDMSWMLLDLAQDLDFSAEYGTEYSAVELISRLREMQEGVFSDDKLAFNREAYMRSVASGWD